MLFLLTHRFIFEAAHTLPRSVESRRIHGHTYHVEIGVVGGAGASGMVVDLSCLQQTADLLRATLDHRFLDDVEGLGAPTLENLCSFIQRRCPLLNRVKVWRADGGGCEILHGLAPAK